MEGAIERQAYMQISPFLEIFVGLFLALGLGIGWFTRIRLVVFALIVAILVFAGIAVAEAQNPPADPRLTVENLQIAGLIAGLAAIPAFLSAGLTRLIKSRRVT